MQKFGDIVSIAREHAAPGTNSITECQPEGTVRTERCGSEAVYIELNAVLSIGGAASGIKM